MTGDDKQVIINNIVEEAMTKLQAAGLDHDGAASLLVIQGATRIESFQKGREAAVFVGRQFPEER